ncbi:VOC family protein [Nocardia sp. NPDC058640]|uniref:VOC family protein n=1 Tax=Nocardia sp. NPDC058640 TaxID=3346571 RepID=UPI003657ABAD
MSPTIASVVIPVSDLAATKAVYTTLYGTPHTDESYYVGWAVGDVQIGLDPSGDIAAGPVAYTAVDDVDTARSAAIDAGATERTAPREVSPGTRICVLEDPNGNPFGLIGK